VSPPDGTRADLLIAGASELITPDPSIPGAVRRIVGGAIAIAGERIIAAGPAAELAATIDLSQARQVDARSGILLPGFVDCHTHLVFGGSRAREYTARLTRAPDAVAALDVPTGIGATVGMTRAASDESLLEAAGARLDAMLAQGTTTAESKTGYGLNLEHELRLLSLNTRLDADHSIDIVSTLMAAHDFPPGATEAEQGRYVESIIEEIIPAAAETGGAEFNDVFCDEGYFTVDQARRVLKAGAAAGLKPKIHTDQYSRLGGSELAAELRVVSADHLNMATNEDLERLAEAGVTGVLMPLIDFAVAHPNPIDARRWVSAGLPIGLATDLCPGGWTVSMPLAMQFACRQSALTPEQALWAATAGGARALQRADRGALEPGLLADVAVVGVPQLEDLIYRIGHAPVTTVVKRGRVVRSMTDVVA
jgi:imidazolonepropionase